MTPGQVAAVARRSLRAAEAARRRLEPQGLDGRFGNRTLVFQRLPDARSVLGERYTKAVGRGARLLVIKNPANWNAQLITARGETIARGRGKTAQVALAHLASRTMSVLKLCRELGFK